MWDGFGPDGTPGWWCEYRFSENGYPCIHADTSAPSVSEEGIDVSVSAWKKMVVEDRTRLSYHDWVQMVRSFGHEDIAERFKEYNEEYNRGWDVRKMKKMKKTTNTNH